MDIPKFTFILFTLPDKRIVLQRRTKDASYAPGMLGIFGGWIEKDETADEGLNREIKEELSIDPELLHIEKIIEFTIPASSDFGKDRYVYLYKSLIPNLNFEVYEGDGAEAFSLDELKERSDLAGSAEFMFKQISNSPRASSLLYKDNASS